jgi:hypothetical protein
LKTRDVDGQLKIVAATPDVDERSRSRLRFEELLREWLEGP